MTDWNNRETSKFNKIKLYNKILLSRKSKLLT